MIRLLVNRLTGRSTALVALETILIVSAVAVAAYVRLGEWAWQIMLEEHGFSKALLIAGVCQVCLYYADLYDLRLVSDRRELFIRIIQALASASFILAALYFWFPALIIGRGVFMISALLVITLVVAWRVAFEWLSRQVGPRERLLLIGTNASAVALAKELYDRRDLSIEIVGFIDPDPARVGTPLLNPGVIGTLDDIQRLTRELKVDRVVVSLADARGQLPMDKLLQIKLAGVSFDHLATVYENYTGKIAVENLRPSWLIFSEGFKKSRLQARLKRSLDCICAALGLTIGAPLFLLTALAVRLSSPGAVLFRQERVGQHEKPFTILKFRSMRRDAEATSGAVWARRNDPRVTRIGAFLRTARLDELPQLWNIFRGDMSFVGPRPERPEFVKDLSTRIPYYSQRHVVKPGLTGWAQVRYPYGSTVEDAMEKLQYDLFYIKHMSVGLDLFIMLNTIKTILLQKGL